MKRCPECRRDYLDETLLYCLDDGAALLTGSGNEKDLRNEPATAILHATDVTDSPLAKPKNEPKIWLLSAIALATVMVVTLGFVILRRPPVSPPPPVAVFNISLPDKTEFNLVRYPALDVAPDGSAIVFSASTEGVSRLFIRRRNESDARSLPGTEGALYPVFSPDSKWIAFNANFTIKRVSVDGEVIPIVQVGDARGIAWADNENLIYSPEPAVPFFRISSDGGKPQQITELDQAKKERTHRWPQVLPGNKVMIFTVGSIESPDNYDNAAIEAVILATGERRLILSKASMARYSPSGHLIFSRGGALYAVHFDPDTLTVSGTPDEILQGIAGDVTTGAVHFAVAGDGTLVYIPGNAGANMRGVSWVDRAGNAQPLNLPPAQYNDIRISPDGSRMAIVIGSSGSGDVWVHDFARATSTRLTFDNKNAAPIWSADGRTIYYSSIDLTGARTTVMRKPSDGGREAEVVASVEDAAYMKAIDSDQTSAIFDYKMIANRGDIVRIPLGSDGPITPIVNTDFNEFGAALSPDTRWLAYQSPENGPPEIWVRDLSGSGGRWQISTAGGEEPRWSPDGRELFYRNNTFFMSTSIDTKTSFSAGAPKTLFTGIFDLRSNSGMSYDIDPKTGRFLMIRPAQSSASAMPVIKVVLNWSNGLQR